jgi:hypothetical protein
MELALKELTGLVNVLEEMLFSITLPIEIV